MCVYTCFNINDMKNICWGASLIILLVCLLTSCEKQNMIESKEVKPITEKKSDEYYANLRAYKKSKHQIFFGWFGGLGAPGDPEVAGVLDHMPDSVDVVGIWGGYPPLGSHNASLLQEIRERKGTKFLITMFGSGVEKLMRKNFPNVPLPEAIDSVAKSIADTISKHQLDGFDLDYEPAYGDRSIFGDSGGSYATNDPDTQRLFKALSQYMGPMSGTGNLLIIDGQFDVGIEPYVNYLMQQAYESSSQSQLQGRLQNFGGGVLPAEKFVPCEDFEKHWKTGGVNFNDPKYGRVPSLIGFAYWQPTMGQKGGIGAYHAEYEYGSTPDFNYIRRAIQIMNPAVK